MAEVPINRTRLPIRRPPFGSGYERIGSVMPHRPIVPKGAPAEHRLDATEVSDLTVTRDPRSVEGARR